jgi:eukaryotic-like serine/threonine-protein kinase
MGIFDRLRSLFADEADQPHASEAPAVDEVPAATVPEPPTTAPMATASDPAALDELGGLLRQLSAAAGDGPSAPDPTAALAAFRRLRGTRHERRALGEILAAEDACRARGGRLPEPLRLEAATLLIDRGELPTARALLATTGAEPNDRPSLAALMLRAEAEERDGDPLAARRSLEQVLAVDMGRVGVRERVARLGEQAARAGRPGAPASFLPAATGGLGVGQLPTLIAAEASTTEHRILAEVGRGGASAVFQAQDLALGRVLALKVFHEPENEREQLLREGELAVRARGAHVIRIFDADPERGFLAMEFCAGGSLRQALRAPPQARPDYTKMDRWLPGLVTALRRVHGLGLVHGDVKAANVLFRGDGAVVLADFGLARAVGEPYTGGTPGALSPERSQGAGAHPDDDVFALGIMVKQIVEAGLAGDDPSARERWLDQTRRWTAPRGTRPATLEGATLTTDWSAR